MLSAHCGSIAWPLFVRATVLGDGDVPFLLNVSVCYFLIEIIPRVWNFTLPQRVVVPLLALGTLESFVGQCFFLCEVDEIPGDAFIN